MTSYLFNVNSQSLTAILTWNANSTLQTLGITDALNSANTQTCNYLHDDLIRLASANCGSAWSQTFSYDAFGNIAKSGSATFAASYNSATNQISSVGGFTPTYDANGNTLTDPVHAYSWDSAGKPVTIDSVNMTYDALGRIVEQNRSGAFTQFVYSPNGGKLAIMSGQALQKAIIALVGGAQAVYNASGLLYYGHSDHLGSIRVGSAPSRTVSFDLAYAPFGETYSVSGSSDPAFTGQRQDTANGLYDFPAREFSNEGRWVSPDPAGLGAVNSTSPQSWNRYSYALNSPLGNIDPSGMFTIPTTWYLGYGAIGVMGCTSDGVDTPCSMVNGMLGSDAAVTCPNNECQRVGNNGLQYFWASTNGPGSYYAYSGPSALFYSSSLAAIDFATSYGEMSEEAMAEYQTNFYQDANGVYSYTNPIAYPCVIANGGFSCTSDVYPLMVPDGTTPIGTGHTHPDPSEGAYPDIITGLDVTTANAIFFDHPSVSILYTVDPWSGRVLMYNPALYNPTTTSQCQAVSIIIGSTNPSPCQP